MITYYIHNSARSVHTRAQRAAAPTHKGLKQHLGGGEHRIVRGNPLQLSETQIKKHMVEIREKVAAGLIHVKTGDGLHVDLDTLKASEPLPLPPPMPNFPLDSIARDKPAGEPMRPQYPGGLPEVLPPGTELPDLVTRADGNEPEEAKEEKEESPIKDDGTDVDGDDDEDEGGAQ